MMSIEERRRAVLEKVASGDLPPDDAIELLEAFSGSGAADEEQEVILKGVLSEQVSASDAARLLASAGTTSAPRVKKTSRDDITSVRVLGTFRTLRIEGDASIKGAVAEGPHEVRTEDGTLVFEDLDDDENGFTLFGPRSRRRGFIFKGNIQGRDFDWRGNRPPELRIRMNPELPLEIDMTAGTARVRNITSAIRTSLAAGSATFEGVRSPFNGSVDAGSLKVRGLFDSGDSQIRCTAGKVRIELEPGSDVRISARATLGKISLPGSEWQGLGGGEREVTIGKGTGSLDIEATTGTAVVEEVGHST